MLCKPLRLTSLLALLAAGACASPAAPPPSDPATAPSPASAAPAAAPAPAASATAATPTATSTTPTTTAAEEPPGPPDPAPLTDEERKEAAKKCAPLTQAMQKAKGNQKSPLDALEAALKKPPAQLKGAALERCKELLTRGIETYLIGAKEVEARLVISQIGRAMAIAYSEQGGKLCPASERPVPADKARVAKEPYVSTAADWDTPSWKCLGISLPEQPQRFQYETRVDPAAKTFEVIARGVPGGKGRWVELRQKGTVTSKGVEMGAVERK
jgi:hypothetical protein